MKQHVEQLYKISVKKERVIIGLMSGTSLDGLDIAVCTIAGSGASTKFRLKEFTTVPYDEEFRKNILEVFSKRDSDLEKLCLLNKSIANRHAYMINECLAGWKIASSEIDLVASHGQTIYHAPRHLHESEIGDATLQIGDGDHIAVGTGIITISDFRQKHIAGGGEGAPLAAYGDHVLFSKDDEDVILLNIGGIANFTFLPSLKSGKKMFSTDCGPGNTLMDAWMQKHFEGHNFDKDAKIASRGRVHEGLLSAMLEDTFFQLPFPKSTGPELFSQQYLKNAIDKCGAVTITPEDVMATLNRLTATVICNSLKTIQSDGNKINVFVSGGGMHNPMVLSYLENNLPGFVVASTAELGINPDAKEAILFAILANECVAGETTTFENYFPSLSMGKISFPS